MQNTMIRFSRGVLLSNPRADISQLHHSEAPELVQLGSRRAASTQKQLALGTKCTVTSTSWTFCVPATLTIEETHVVHLKKKKKDTFFATGD